MARKLRRCQKGASQLIRSANKLNGFIFWRQGAITVRKSHVIEANCLYLNAPKFSVFHQSSLWRSVKCQLARRKGQAQYVIREKTCLMLSEKHGNLWTGRKNGREEKGRSRVGSFRIIKNVNRRALSRFQRGRPDRKRSRLPVKFF